MKWFAVFLVLLSSPAFAQAPKSGAPSLVPPPIMLPPLAPRTPDQSDLDRSKQICDRHLNRTPRIVGQPTILWESDFQEKCEQVQERWMVGDKAKRQAIIDAAKAQQDQQDLNFINGVPTTKP